MYETLNTGEYVKIIIIIIQISNTTNFDQDNARWENSQSHKTSRGDKSSLYT